MSGSHYSNDFSNVDMSYAAIAKAVRDIQGHDVGSVAWFQRIAQQAIVATLKDETAFLHEIAKVTLQTASFSRGEIAMRFDLAHLNAVATFFAPPIPDETSVYAQARGVFYDLCTRLRDTTWGCIWRGRARVIAPGWVVADEKGVPLWWVSPAEPHGMFVVTPGTLGDDDTCLDPETGKQLLGCTMVNADEIARRVEARKKSPLDPPRTG